MKMPLSVLFVEDSTTDVELMLLQLSASNYSVEWTQVYTEADLRQALAQRAWDIVLCDFVMPGFDGARALVVVREQVQHLPFIFVSGAIGEDVAVEAMQAGAQDYVMKHNLKRLLPAIERALREAIIKRDRNRMHERLDFLAHHDPLTGLANRSLFLDHLSLAIHDAHRNNSSVAVAFVDVDKFKLINDTYGHEAGDEILKFVASQMSSCARRSDTVARLAGDEFGVILGKIDNPHDITRIVQSILNKVALPVRVAGADVVIRLSIGIAVYPTDGREADELLRNADVAMYRAKQAGGGYEFFTAEMQRSVQKRVLAEATLRDAVAAHQLQLHFQPIISVAERRVIAMESLLRWPTEQGVMLPAEFLPLAEQSGLILPISEWALRHACEQCLNWRQAGFGLLRVSVNVSLKQFQRYNLFETIQITLNDAGLDPAALELEINELALTGSDSHIFRTLTQLHDTGITLAIGNFGIGYSSLGHLRRLPVDVLKIDSSFTRNVVDNLDDRNIVKAIVGMAECLHIRVVAQGVETRQQAEVLRAQGCQYLQGLFCGGALLPSEVFPWLNTARESDLFGVR
ncbi:MAG: EAL domain-containing protein [Gammaproteobacteria bacterium]|nr:EAL domain-containing protein [Gammaproteobacteria bacterium]